MRSVAHGVAGAVTNGVPRATVVDGREPHAVVQLRREDRAGQMWNLVGFQTRLRIPEQQRVFRMIPGLAKELRPYKIAVIGLMPGFVGTERMAIELGAGLVPVRKLGKLPAETITVEYALEYGSNTLEIHRDAIEPGQKVLIHAGAGGLGSTVVQVAKHLGAHVATTARTNDVDKVRALGADEVIDFTQQDFTDVLSGYDVVLDSLGAASLEKSLTVLKPGGLAISVVGPPDPHFATQLGQPLFKPVMAVLSRKIRRQARTRGVRRGSDIVTPPGFWKVGIV